MFHMGWFLSYAVQSWGQTWSGQGATEWTKPGLWVDAARSLERAGFDYLMLEDGSFIPDAYGGSAAWTLAKARSAPKHDPLTLVATLAQHTDRIGLIATVTSAFYPPFLAARLLTTLDHLTGGRVGVNVVTSHNDRTAQNYGRAGQLPHDQRYAIADDWLAAMEALWQTWDPDALTLDEQTGQFADPDKVHHAHYAGEHFRTRGPLNLPPGPQRRPVICQAGGSPAGRAFAAAHADTIVAQARTVEDMRAYREDISARAVVAGRDPRDIKILFLAAFTLAETDDEASALFEARTAVSDVMIEENLAMLSFASGIDFGAFDLDAPLPAFETNAAQSVVALHLRGHESGTLRDAVSKRMTGALDFVGSPASVAAQMQEAFEESGGDGFIVQSPITRRTVTEIADGLAPELRRRGLIRDGYAHPTLRENLLAF